MYKQYAKVSIIVVSNMKRSFVNQNYHLIMEDNMA